jgi:hypothetical protein
MFRVRVRVRVRVKVRVSVRVRVRVRYRVRIGVRVCSLNASFDSISPVFLLPGTDLSFTWY